MSEYSPVLGQLRADDFGIGLYDECITKNATFADGNWQFIFPSVPGEKGKKPGPADVVRLTKPDAAVALGNLYKGNSTQTADYKYRPEHACYAICQKALGSGCTTFTYDGLDKDSCAAHGCLVFACADCSVQSPPQVSLH